ncbi:DNA transformation protein TfoX [Vibrio aerogenes CECT 7868]|uniref:DNA transformation protein TfoX n=1 Tax=Vibrio aerogenes CECT 7868 TaxID=1216006 RepID=A0A1M5XTN8_9VIBR|nr:TfoX/Sxy family DNA transformation protein [Vibrio aerogenes]SHI02904.1 DNA transformation protein TfoX [Vibrio aerogenes CECT 7868]
MIATKFFDYLLNREKFDTKSIFGDIGVFCQGAMFALVNSDYIYIRGGGELDNLLHNMGYTGKYVLVKKQSSVRVNYYNITDLFLSGSPAFEDILQKSKQYALTQKHQKTLPENKRLRDLPNLHLTIERMLKKSGVPDVMTFYKLGAVQCYSKVRQTYGHTVDVKLLWKFAGAIEGIYWELIREPRQQQLILAYEAVRQATENYQREKLT